MIAVWRALLPACLALALVAGAGAQPQPLRGLDWTAVLAADPSVLPAEDCVPAPALARHGPCVQIPLATPERPGDLSGREAGVTAISGYAATLDVLYADLDGDGAEEAVLRVESGTGGGTFGFLLYRAAGPAPLLVAAVPGYRMGVAIVDGMLVSTQPLSFGFEPGCCPTGLEQTRWQLDGAVLTRAEARLFATGEAMRAVTLPELVVHGFYRALTLGHHEAAYAFLSDDLQAAEPFASWREPYAALRSIAVDTQPGAAEDEVQVTVTAINEDGAPRRFIGHWRLVPDPAGPGGYRLASGIVRNAE